MKRSQMKVLLLAEGAVCALLALALRLIEGDAFSVAGFPGGAIGQGLSVLAASGRLGFALALTLYAFCVLLPLYVLARIGERRKLKSEDALLALIAVAGRLLEHIGGDSVSPPCLAVAHFRAARGLGRAAAAASLFRRRHAGAFASLPRAARACRSVLRLCRLLRRICGPAFRRRYAQSRQHRLWQRRAPADIG